MIDFQYLYRGICGLARAHRAGSLSGHLGAAVAAGYFFGENQPDLDDKVYLPILDEELGKLKRAEEDPRTPAYWSREKSEQHSAWLTHRIKTLYGFFTLLRFVDDEATRAKALEQFGYLMA